MHIHDNKTSFKPLEGKGLSALASKQPEEVISVNSHYPASPGVDLWVQLILYPPEWTTPLCYMEARGGDRDKE